MTEKEYQQLAKLLNKLGTQINADRFCIIPKYIHDGCHIGVYNTNGEILKSVTAPNIQEAVKQLNLEL